MQYLDFRHHGRHALVAMTTCLVDGVTHFHRLLLCRQHTLGKCVRLVTHQSQFAGDSALAIRLGHDDMQQDAGEEQAAAAMNAVCGSIQTTKFGASTATALATSK